VRVALVGYGYWGPNYARIFSELPGSEMATICEPAQERRQRAQVRHPQVESLSDAQQVLGRTDVDAVVISTPATSRFALARAVLETHWHVLVEKPLAFACGGGQICSLCTCGGPSGFARGCDQQVVDVTR
jgi:predicted dehydrogenase